jgi:hypothetical protein
MRGEERRGSINRVILKRIFVKKFKYRYGNGEEESRREKSIEWE